MEVEVKDLGEPPSMTVSRGPKQEGFHIMLMELPGGNSKLVISIGMVLPYPVGTQLRI